MNIGRYSLLCAAVVAAASSVVTVVDQTAKAAGTAKTAGVYNRPSAIFPAGDAEHGKELAETCVACHGENIQPFGDPPFSAPKLKHQHPASIFYALEDYTNGSRKSDIMTPMVESLSEQDMRDLSVYLSGPPAQRRSGAPGQAPPPPRPLESGAGHTKVVQYCGFCHGLTGQGVMDGVPVLGGQHQDYLKHALAAYASGERSNPTMQLAVKNLTPQETEDVTAYLAAQSTLDVER